jgi:S-adenosylmethionine:tRNA ribosyltransferase-isomerase
MWRQDYQFELPESLIARRPPEVRGDSRLMVLPAGSGMPVIEPFSDLTRAFRGDEVLVLNDTRVVPARVRGTKATGGAVEVFVVGALETPAGGDPSATCRIEALLRGKRLQAGVRLRLPGAEAVVVGPLGEGTFAVDLQGVADLYTWLEAVGELPLPPYLDRPADEADRTRYQTVFARQPGAVAAPTAGLHFTEPLLAALRDRGVTVATVTLHVGLGTFLPVRVDDLDAHVMHEERYAVPEATRALLASGRPVVAVGTTVVRTLESYAREPSARSTRIFIRPGFDFRLVDGLVTNFHLPESTLLMLVSAFVGRERVLDAYAQAVRAEMRFFSYGDAMLLRRPGGRWT